MSEKKSEMVAVMLPTNVVKILASKSVESGYMNQLKESCMLALRPEPPTSQQLRDLQEGCRMDVTGDSIADWIEYVLAHGWEPEQ